MGELGRTISRVAKRSNAIIGLTLTRFKPTIFNASARGVRGYARARDFTAILFKEIAIFSTVISGLVGST